MIRVKFTRDHEQYSENACIVLPDEHANELIDKGVAKQIAGIPSLGDPTPGAAVDTMRIRFTADVSESGKVRFAAGEVRILPKHEAQRLIENGRAEAFPIMSVGAEVEQKAAPLDAHDKMAHGVLTK
jgi:hypothetical protein